MQIKDLRVMDPQRVVYARFGKLKDEDSAGNFTVEWSDESWIPVRILTSEGDNNEWYMTPLSPEGRPYGSTFIGHAQKGENLFWDERTFVMQIRSMIEGGTLRAGYESGQIISHLKQQGIILEDLSPLGRIFVKALTDYEEVPESLLEEMLGELCR